MDDNLLYYRKNSEWDVPIVPNNAVQQVKYKINMCEMVLCTVWIWGKYVASTLCYEWNCGKLCLQTLCGFAENCVMNGVTLWKVVLSVMWNCGK